MFEKVSSKINFPQLELEILKFWKDEDIFKRSVKQRSDNDEYVFYDGPPFATGLPHYGHLLAGTIKDVVPRYQTMCGKYVERVFGWDCHGLPVENEMEQELGIKSKKGIEEYGIGKFNESCRKIVLRYTSEWEQTVKRIGRWVDFENGYRTMDRNYMESIWWVFKELWKKELIYEGYKVLPYCPRDATPLSNFEANQGYKEVNDPSITVRFKLVGQTNTYILVWTTTPWTLPSNVALAVGKEIEYLKVLDDGNYYILASELLPAYYSPSEAQPKIIEKMTGDQLVGATYEPLFPYFPNLADQGAYRVVAADFISTSDGTGVVHIAPGFGEDDAAVGKANSLPTLCPIDSECCFSSEIDDYSGRFVKDCDKDIIIGLKKEGKLIKKGVVKHSYPHCWRCDSPLIYRSVSTWFVNVESIKERLVSANKKIHWVPNHIKDGRFGKWLANAHDWAISRNRFWGCPLPIWKDKDTGETVCIGSISELEDLSGCKVDDIHKHFVDEIAIKSPKTGSTLSRIPEVLDCWFDSGAMPYAQRHYPFENKQWLDQHFPADFIAEGLDQTRGWFYTLVVLGSALFDKPPFKNVIVNGLVLAEDGRKMSKRLKNYPDPLEIMDRYGADALRLCLLSSPVMRGEDLRFSENAVKESIRSVMLPLWNAYSFLVTYASVDQWQPTISLSDLPKRLNNSLDKWIFSKLTSLVTEVRNSLDNYDLQIAATRFASFIDDLTNWYIRRSRRRFWKSENDTDKDEAYHTLYHVLVTYCQTSAPFIPFIVESIYKNLRLPKMPDSVHLCDYPNLSTEYSDVELERRMSRVIRCVSLARSLRSKAGIRVRQPLKSTIIVSADAQVRDDIFSMKTVIEEELNVKAVIIEDDEQKLAKLHAKANFKSLGPRLGKNMKEVANIISRYDDGEIKALRKGNTKKIILKDTTEIEISIDDIEILHDEKPGITTARDAEITVALDLNLDEELEMEGWAREVVNRVQNLRKEANLDVADRIRIKYSVPETIEKAIKQFSNYITKETLAVELCQNSNTTPVEAIELGPHTCKFSVERI